MGWFDPQESDLEKYGDAPPPPPVASRHAKLDDQSRDLVTQDLPRGVAVLRGQPNREERAQWASPENIGALRAKFGDILLGKFGGVPLGYMDDKPMVTVASARAGKTSTVLVPTLLMYPGSMLVLDPKGELAQETALHRRDVLGHTVHVLDPFGCTGLPSAHFNALAELDPFSPDIIDDAALIAQSLVLDEPGSDSSHWVNSARELVKGLVLHTLQQGNGYRNLVTTWELLRLTFAPLQSLGDKLKADGVDASAEAVQLALFETMAAQVEPFGGEVAGAGRSLLRKNPRERAGIISTAEPHLSFLSSIPIKEVSRASDFRLSDLAERNTTIYLCLPSGRMQTHFRWLRLVVRMALRTLERRGRWPRDRLPMIFLMEEFASLGHMPIMEQAAAYFPGFGVKLWCVLQDLTQLQRHYRESWQTFLGNASVVQAFANADEVTLDYISRRLGYLSFVRGSSSVSDEGKNYRDKERLLHTHEMAKLFARATGNQILLVEGHDPIAAIRFSHEDIAELRRRATLNLPGPERAALPPPT